MQTNFYGDYCHYKNKYEDAQSEVLYWKEQCDRRQQAFDCLAAVLKPDASVQELMDELFPVWTNE